MHELQSKSKNQQKSQSLQSPPMQSGCSEPSSLSQIPSSCVGQESSRRLHPRDISCETAERAEITKRIETIWQHIISRVVMITSRKRCVTFPFKVKSNLHCDRVKRDEHLARTDFELGGVVDNGLKRLKPFHCEGGQFYGGDATMDRNALPSPTY